MSYMIKRIYQGLMFKTEGIQFHPYIGILVLLIQISLMFFSHQLILFSLLIIVFIENMILHNSKGALSILYAIFPLIIFVGGMLYFFSGPVKALSIVIRLVSSALGFSFFFAVTNPSDLTRALENLHIPAKAAFLPSLMLMLAPRISKDADETLETLRLKEETKGFILKWLPKIIAVFIASVIYRSEFLAQALYYKGFGLKKRTHFKKLKIKTKDLARFVVWIVIIVLCVLVRAYIPDYVTNIITN